MLVILKRTLIQFSVIFCFQVFILQKILFMEIPDLQSEEGEKFLDNFLKDKSYIAGYEPSKADILVWEKIKKCPSDKYDNLHRWFIQISSFDSNEKKVLPSSDLELKFAGPKIQSASASEGKPLPQVCQ